MKGDDEAVIAEEVQKVNSQFYHAFESLSIERMERLWKHEDNIVCIHPGWDLFAGWLAVRESWITIFANTEMIRFTITNTKVRVFNNNDDGKIAAVVVCLENIETSVNRQNVKLGVIATNIFEKIENQQWLLIHHHGSSLSNYISPNVYS
jgi:ketosteroid isomerase-like protein